MEKETKVTLPTKGLRGERRYQALMEFAEKLFAVRDELGMKNREMSKKV